MKLSAQFLQKLVGKSVDNLDQLILQHITEVEEYHPLTSITGVVIGHVLTCINHPDSDHLHITTVNIGSKVEQIVCGAPNVAAGQYVLVATVGAVLPEVTIKASKIRGIESNGMICSLRELGINERFIEEQYQNGIYYFPDELEHALGEDGLTHLCFYDHLLDYAIPSNRPDLLSAVGLAREVSAAVGLKLKLPTYKVKQEGENPYLINAKYQVPYYSVTILSDLEIAPSPWWLKQILMTSDMKPINNVVDISNYICLKYGTPNHTFDAKTWQSKEIAIRKSTEGEKVVTLDGVDRILSKTDVLICDKQTPMALAGVMGLECSMITPETTQVLFELANFESEDVKQTSKRLGLSTDSSIRFEKQIDENLLPYALNEALYLFATLAKGKASKTNFVSKTTPEKKIIKVEEGYFTKLLGITISNKVASKLLNNLGLNNTLVGKELVVTVDTTRKDIKDKSDLAEEVLRFYGFDKVVAQPLGRTTLGILSLAQKRTRALRQKLSSYGLNECVTYSLIKPKDVLTENQPRVLSPISEDHVVLRENLLIGLLAIYAHNLSYHQSNFNLFEIGKVFSPTSEDLHLGVLLSGTVISNAISKQKIAPDFSLIKGISEQIASVIGVSFSYLPANSSPSLHPYIQANILYNEQVIGVVGKVIKDDYYQSEIYYLELNLDLILHVQTPLIYQPISVFPTIERDLAVVIDQNLNSGEIEKVIRMVGKKWLVSLSLFDVYTGPQVGDGKKSLAYHLLFSDATKTLTNPEIDKVMHSIINRLEFSFQAQVRQ